MAFCTKCGTQLDDNVVYCTVCGTPTGNQQQNYQQPTYQQPVYQQPYNGYQYENPNDSGSIGWAFLGYFIPIVGLILFITWNKEKPKCAKKAGIGALIGVIVNFVVLPIIFAIVVSLLGIGLASSEYYDFISSLFMNF